MPELNSPSSEQWPCTCHPSQLVYSLQQAVTNFTKSAKFFNPIEACQALSVGLCQPYFSGDHHNHQRLEQPETSSLVTPGVYHPRTAEIWGYGLLSVCLVCSCAVFGLCFYPLMKRKVFHYILTWLIGLAIGTLSGIALFHLIPQSFELSYKTDEDIGKYIHKSLVIIASIYAFFVAERLFKIAMQRRQGKEQFLQVTFSPKVSTISGPPKAHPAENGLTVPDQSRKASMAENVEVQMNHEHAHFHGHGDSGSGPIKTVAWLIIFGDSLVDGLSLGAAFNHSVLQGVSIAIAIFCEELPHELGDLAILLRSGLSLKRSVIYNCLSSITCFIGFIVGVFLGELASASTWIFAVASGMFIYISFVNILPEMTAAIEEAGESGMKQAVIVLALQTFGIIVGVVLMYVLGRFSSQINF